MLNRITIGVVSLLLQIAVLVFGILILSEYYVYMSVFFLVLSIIMLFRVLQKSENPTFKLAWSIFILLLPIMGGALFMQQRAFDTVGEAAVFGFGSGFGWWIAILVMAAIRERLAYSNVPKGLRGPGLAFIITGLLGMAFMIFSGFQM